MMLPAVWKAEKWPVVATVTAAAYSTRAVASLKRASPSRIVSNRRGSRNRRATLVAAAASVGPTAVPSTKATAQDRWPIQWAAAAVAMAVATTSNTASVPIDRASRRNPVGEDVTAASKLERSRTRKHQ